eukprot:scaffold25802_cov41-Phaeocystis_antarctica.AAC.1
MADGAAERRRAGIAVSDSVQAIKLTRHDAHCLARVGWRDAAHRQVDRVQVAHGLQHGRLVAQVVLGASQASLVDCHVGAVGREKLDDGTDASYGSDNLLAPMRDAVVQHEHRPPFREGVHQRDLHAQHRRSELRR